MIFNLHFNIVKVDKKIWNK